MVLGFGSKEKDEEESRERSRNDRSPTEEVRKLASQGYSEQEIFRELRDMGYPNDKITKSINKVLKNKVSSSRGEADVARGPQRSDRGPEPPGNSGQRQSSDRFVAPEPSVGQDAGGRQSRQENEDPFSKFESNRKSDDVWEMTEEEEIELEILIEEIIDEKWVAVETELERFREEKDEFIRRIERLEEKVAGLEERHEDEREKLEEKTEKTFDHVKSVESRVGSVEKAFKEFLPQLTENVRSLSSVVKDLEGSASRSQVSSSLDHKNIPDSPESYLDEESEGSDTEDSASAIPG